MTRRLPVRIAARTARSLEPARTGRAGLFRGAARS